MKLGLGVVAGGAIVATFLLIAADKIGLIHLRQAPPPVEKINAAPVDAAPTSAVDARSPAPPTKPRAAPPEPAAGN